MHIIRWDRLKTDFIITSFLDLDKHLLLQLLILYHI